jgi:uncharacterized protein YbgA (DUF1722 family)
MIIAHSRTFYDNLQLLVSQTRQDSVKGLFDRYGDILFRALMNPPTYDSNNEVMLQAFGYFEKNSHLERENSFFGHSIVTGRG